MQVVPLSAVPNQTFTVTLDGNRYAFGVYQANGVCCYDISVNEVPTVLGQRLTIGSFLLPFFYLQGQNGNFIFLTQAEQLPDYTAFNDTQTLIYMTFAEIQAAVNAVPKPINPTLVPYAVAS